MTADIILDHLYEIKNDTLGFIDPIVPPVESISES